MSASPWYAWYVGDARAKMARLSLAEQGAYRALLDEIYITGEGLPAEIEALCRIVGAQTELERDAVQAVARRYLPIGADGLRHNKRADREIVRQAIFRLEQSRKGKLRAAGARDERGRLAPAGPAESPAEHQPNHQPGTSLPQPQPQATGYSHSYRPGESLKRDSCRLPTATDMSALVAPVPTLTEEESSNSDQGLVSLRSKAPPSPPIAAAPPPPVEQAEAEQAKAFADDIDRVHEHWVIVTRSTPGAQSRARNRSTSAYRARRAVIAAKLREDYGAETLMLAIDEVARTPWNAGANPGGKTYLELAPHILHHNKLDALIERVDRRRQGLGPRTVPDEYVDQAELERARERDRQRQKASSVQKPESPAVSFPGPSRAQGSTTPSGQGVGRVEPFRAARHEGNTRETSLPTMFGETRGNGR